MIRIGKKLELVQDQGSLTIFKWRQNSLKKSLAQDVDRTAEAEAIMDRAEAKLESLKMSMRSTWETGEKGAFLE